jgi:Cu+-exporting ATPase
MKKTIIINGMSCQHCVKRVEKALNNIDDVKANVILDQKLAILQFTKEIDNQTITKAIEDLGYQVVEIKKE